MLRPILLTTSFVGISILTVFAGCSSSSSKATGGNDSGSAADVVVHHDSGSSSGSSSGGSGDDSGDDSGDSGGSCSAGVPYTATTWTNVVAHQGLCDAADLAAFLAACGDSPATATTCNAWIATNLAGADGGGGSTCGNCIVPPNATGTGGASFVTFDSMGNGYFGPNYPGCIQLLDPTNGPACAAAYDNINECLGLECNLCTGTDGDGTPEDPEACENLNVGTGGICASYLSPYQTKCATDNADGGIADQCSPGAAEQKTNPDWTLIINLICGSATSGDSGGG